MGKIQTLDKHLANLIAAGEVVERPASAVKELIENAVDAEASAITVEIEKGGLASIRVTDNGAGIERDDIRKAFLRHATSKINSEKDLGEIRTMGFRGEALASIAAVSKITVYSKERSEMFGTCFMAEGGAETAFEEAGCPVGTTMVVRELFFNTPARMKFIKRDITEAGYIKSVVRRAALAYQKISFKFISDGKEELHTPGDNSLISAIYSVFGEAFAAGLERVKLDYEGVSVFGYVSRPVESQGNRQKQEFFVNQRPIRSKTLSAALEEAYKNVMMVNRFPAAVLHIDIHPALLDVNVHPAKSEIKFAFEKQVFDAVYFAVKGAVGREDARVEVVQHRKIQQDLFEDGGTDPYKANFRIADEPVRSLEKNLVGLAEPKEETRAAEQRKEEMQAVAQPHYVEHPAPVWRILGEAFDTFILVQDGEDLLFVDKHAAHERILFEKLKAVQGDPLTQILLEPAVLHPDPLDYDIWMTHLPLLGEMGFELEDFGGGAMLLRTVPEGIDAHDAEATLQEFAEACRENRRWTETQKREEAMRLVSCKAALKAGSISGPLERRALIERVMQFDDIKYCPHGRPVAALLKKSELEHRLGRT